LATVPGMPNTTIRYAAAATAALSLSLLTACGSGSGGGVKDKGTGQVASLQSPSADGGKNTSSLSSENGVQLRLDMTDDEKTDVMESWQLCLVHQGLPSYTKQDGKRKLVLTQAPRSKYPKEYKACESKQPIQPPEMDPQKNPHYMDDYRTWIKCMNDKGFAVEALPDGDGWTFASHPGRVDPNSAKANQIEFDCKLEAFGGGK